MSKLVGYRTVLFNIIMAVASMVGLNISPDMATHFAGVLIVVWAAGGILLRFVTSTPAFASSHPQTVELANEIAANLPKMFPDGSETTTVVPQAPATGTANTGQPDIVAMATDVTNALAVAQHAFDTVYGHLVAATSTVSAAQPQAIIASDLQPEPNPAPAPAVATTNQGV